MALSPDFPRISGGTDYYARIYRRLRSQRTIVESIAPCLTNPPPSPSADDSKCLQILSSIEAALTTATYGTLFAGVSEALPVIRDLITLNLSDPIKSYCSRFLVVCVNLAHLHSYLTGSGTAYDPAQSSSEIESDDQSQDTSETSDRIICRICDRLIPLDSVSEHLDGCLRAHESSETVKELDESMLREIGRVQNSLLNVGWPGDESAAVPALLSVLHFVSLVEAAAAIEEVPEALDQLAQLHGCLSMITVFQRSQDVLDIFLTIRGLIEKKKCALAVLSLARESAGATLFRPRSSQPSVVPSMRDFRFVRRFAGGGYAKVFLAEKIVTGDLYAIKALPKNVTRQKNGLEQVLTEKTILSRAMDHMVKFFYSIVGENNLYLVMEYVAGGDLCGLLNGIGSLDEESTRTYAAEIVAALVFLRANNIVHRDLKPRNLVVSANGLLKLIDFGLSSWGILDRGIVDEEPVPRVVGTPEYMAPEIICQQPHTFTADYWALGCLVYEMLMGTCPFLADDYETTFAKVLNGTYDRDALAENSPEVQDFIQSLLQTDPAKRLGNRSIDELRDHPWFTGIDWNHLDRLSPPYVPKLRNPADTGYFESVLDAEGDADILEDINLGTRPKSARNEPSFMESDSFSPPPPSPEQMLETFPAVGVSELGGLTIRAAERMIQDRIESFPAVGKNPPRVGPPRVRLHGASLSGDIPVGSRPLASAQQGRPPAVLSRSVSRGASRSRLDDDGSNRLAHSDD